MTSIKLDFFYDGEDHERKVINTLSDYFSIDNKVSIKKCLDSLDKNRLDDEDVLKFVKEFNLDLKKKLYDDIQLKCKHGATTIDNLISLKELGLVSLNTLLSIDSPISNFLVYNDVRIDAKKRILSFKGKDYSVLNSEELCDKCIYGKIECQNKFSNLDCEYRGDLYLLYLKLYKDNGATEVFVSSDFDEIYDYSRIRYYPEILHTIDNILIHFNGTRVLANDWEKKSDKIFYVFEFYSSIINFEYIPTRTLYEGYWSIANILEYFDYDEYNFEEDCISSTFYINLFVLYQLVNNYDKMRLRKFGCLLPEIVIPWKDISICKKIEM